MRALLVLAAAGCAGAPLASDTADTARCDPEWEDFGPALTLAYCDACHARTTADRHGAPEAVAFDTLTDATQWAERMWARVEAGEMPPGGGISSEEVELLGAWVACVTGG